jgi:hypothetical protein
MLVYPESFLQNPGHVWDYDKKVQADANFQDNITFEYTGKNGKESKIMTMCVSIV